ncbi:MAG: 4-hydroxy-tetrahydrodipicolinate synthase [Coprobacillus sp.]|nr:4-hydroxy-tetrahydrodipicolinate synthase [Coprobacillus sp.]
MKEIFTALITPFNQDQSIDYPGLYRIIDKLIEEGNKSFLLCGTTGETSTLKLDERRILVENILKKYPQIRIIIGICSNSTSQVIRHIHMYKDDPRIYAYLVIVPYYIKPSQEGIYKHFDLIAASTSKKIMIYNIPSRCGVGIAPSTVIRLANKHKNIIGMKQCGELNDIQTIKEELSQFKVYIGDDHLLLEGLKQRADGIISVTNHLDFQLIEKICKNENIFDDRYLKLISEYIFIEPSPAPIKYILSELGYIQNILRLPLTTISEESQVRLAPLIEKYRK